MPQIVIGNRRYHLVKRIVVRLELRSSDYRHEIIASGESICRAGDKFDERQGMIWAFKNLMSKPGPLRAFFHYSEGDGLRHGKAERANAWKQVLGWINGVKRPVVKMRKQSAIAKALAAQNNLPGRKE